MNGDYSGEEVPLLHLLPVIYRLIKLTDAHKQYGLTKTQTVMLIAIYYRESVTMGELAQYISSSKEQATRAVAALCDNGLVERFENPENRTHVYIRFTDKGREFMRQLSKMLRAQIDERLALSLTEDEIAALRQSVRTSIEILSRVK